MTTLAVLGGLGLLLALACWWEARRGTPEWGRSREPGTTTLGDASGTAQRGTAAALGLGALELGGGDG